MTPETVVANAFGHDASEINDATSPQTISEWDSLGHVTLIIELEAAYGVSFAPEETMTLMDVAAIKTALRSRGLEW